MVKFALAKSRVTLGQVGQVGHGQVGQVGHGQADGQIQGHPSDVSTYNDRHVGLEAAVL